MKTIADLYRLKFNSDTDKNQWISDNIETVKNALNKFCFTKEFADYQMKLFNSFYTELSQTDFFKHLNNWDKKDSPKIASEILIDKFYNVYGLKNKPNIILFDETDFLKNNPKYNKAPLMQANYEKNTIPINLSKTKTLSNKSFISGIFHECLHFYQVYGKFNNYSAAQKSFNFSQNRNKELYYYLPNERHAHALQYMFLKKLDADKKFINKTEGKSRHTVGYNEQGAMLLKYMLMHDFSGFYKFDAHQIKELEDIKISESLSKLSQNEKKSNIDYVYDQIFSTCKVNYILEKKIIEFTTINPDILYEMFGRKNIIKMGLGKYKTKPISKIQEQDLKAAYVRNNPKSKINSRS